MSFPELLQPLAREKTSSSLIGGLAFLLFVSLILCILSACSRQTSYPAPSRIGPDIVIDTAGLELEVPKFYTYQFHDKQINFFVIKTEDRILSFLDACASCYPHKQGYRFEDSAIICRHCNVRLPVNNLEKGIGNCYPIKIEGRMGKGKYLIAAETLEKAADKF